MWLISWISHLSASVTMLAETPSDEQGTTPYPRYSKHTLRVVENLQERSGARWIPVFDVHEHLQKDKALFQHLRYSKHTLRGVW